MIAMTIGTVLSSGLKILNPSMAEETEIGGVIIPSASSVPPPMMAAQINLGFLLRINAKREKIPPSPLLSARNVMKTYLKVVL